MQHIRLKRFRNIETLTNIKRTGLVLFMHCNCLVNKTFYDCVTAKKSDQLESIGVIRIKISKSGFVFVGSQSDKFVLF